METFDAETDAFNKLKEMYTKIGSPIAFASPYKIYLHFKKILPLEKIKNYLHSINTYTLHRQNRKKAKYYSPVFTYNKRDLIEIDIFDLTNMSTFNDGMKYGLLCIDAFTRKVWIRMIHTREAKTVLSAFQDIHQEMIKGSPRVKAVCNDLGAELIGTIFRNYLNYHGIQQRNPKRLTHCSFAERAIRSIKSLIMKYCTHNKTKRYVDKIQDIVNSYNDRYHRMIKCTPNQAEMKKNTMYLREVFEDRYSKLRKKKPIFTIGQLVRISKAESKFKRSYQEQIQKEVFLIQDVDTSKKIPTYSLSTLDQTEILIGKWMSFELVSVKPTMNFQIDKIIKRKRNQSLVTFYGLPENYKSWINTEELGRNLNDEPVYFQPLLKHV